MLRILLVCLMFASVARGQSSQPISDDATRAAMEKLKARQAERAATSQPTAVDDPAKLKLEIAGLKHQIELLRSENEKLKKATALAPIPVHVETYLEQAKKGAGVVSGNNIGVVRASRDQLEHAKSIDDQIRRMLASGEINQKTAESMWLGKVEIGMTVAQLNVFGLLQLKSEATGRRKEYYFSPWGIVAQSESYIKVFTVNDKVVEFVN